MALDGTHKNKKYIIDQEPNPFIDKTFEELY